jgi:hypothetical protein
VNGNAASNALPTGSGDLFSTFRAEHRTLSRELERLVRPAIDSMRRPGSLDYSFSDEVLVDHHLADFMHETTPPSVREFSKLGPFEISHYGQRG